MRFAIIALSAILLLPTAASAAIYLVRPDGSGDFPTIHAAINAAANGDIVALADGVFRGTGNRDISFAGKAITVTSLNADPDLVSIDCQGSLQDPHRGFVFQTGEGASSILECVTVENAYSTGEGGGMYCSGASPAVGRCLFRNCHAGGGGGASCWGSSVTLTDCIFSGNTAGAGGGASFWFCATAPYPVLTRCTFFSNSSSGDGGALFYYACQSTLANATLYASGGSYGAVSLIHRSVITLSNSIIAFGNRGASIYVEGGGAEAILTCCDIYGNAGGDWVPPFDGQLGIDGNICADPLLCDASSGDLRLTENSPCAPAQNPACGLVGAWPIGCSSGVVDGLPTGSGPGIWTVPNPFVGGTKIAYRGGPDGSTAGISIAIYDVTGRLVRALQAPSAPGGTGLVSWDGTDDEGRALPGGIYLLCLAGDGRTVTERVVRIR
jgi:hypothetical protein